MAIEIKEMTIRVKAGVSDSAATKSSDEETDVDEKIKEVLELMSKSKNKKDR